MNSRQRNDYAAITAVVALTRVLFRSHYLYDIDSINFALALKKFDPTLMQPHPPGYYLYVLAGRGLNWIFQDPNSALVAISILASCGMALAVYALAERWYGIAAARCAALLFMVSPLCWFHGTVALTYIVEGFFSALLGYLCWEVYSGRRTSLVPGAIVLGLAVGFRQSSILFLGPLWLLVWPKASRRQIYLGGGAFCLVTLSWFVPMMMEAGGPLRYFNSLYGIWSAVAARKTVFASSLWGGVALGLSRTALILFIFALCFGPFLCMPLLLRSVKRQAPARRRFVGVWTLPGFLFFSSIYLIFVNSGYLLILSPPLFAWIGSRTAEWLDGFREQRWLKAATLTVAAAVNIAIFLWAPWYCSYRSVRTLEADLTALRQSVRERFSPRETVLVSFDSHFLGFRHVGYYLPEFLTLTYPMARLPEGNKVLGMESGQTLWLADLPSTRENFAIVSLPKDSRYDAYLHKVLARFPGGALQTLSSSGRPFYSGQLQQLRYLFPDLFTPSDIAYTPVHTGR